jgi:hypothetical protein
VNIRYLNQLGKDLAQSFYRAFQNAQWEAVTLSDGGGSHLGIISGPGTDKAGALKIAIEAATPYKIDLDKPTLSDWGGDLVYLSVGTNSSKDVVQ